MFETERLILRCRNESDAEDLYKYASDPDVGPIAGWPAHQSIEESRDVIKNVFNGKEAYAVCLKERMGYKHAYNMGGITSWTGEVVTTIPAIYALFTISITYEISYYLFLYFITVPVIKPMQRLLHI